MLLIVLYLQMWMAGKFYTLTTGANERRWDKMKDRLQTVIESFKIFNVWLTLIIIICYDNNLSSCENAVHFEILFVQNVNVVPIKMGIKFITLYAII